VVTLTFSWLVKMQSISALLNRGNIEALELAERTLLRPPTGTEQYLVWTGYVLERVWL
jgi:hypothetical protein